MIDTDKYEGHTPPHWEVTGRIKIWKDWIESPLKDVDIELMQDAPLLLAEVKRLCVGIRNILSDYDITELIRDVPEEEWNFEQQALVRMKELIE